MRNRYLVWFVLAGVVNGFFVGNLLSSPPNDLVVVGEVWENGFGRLEVNPDVSTEIITQVQYANFTSYLSDNYYDIAFRFDNPLDISRCDIWMWKNISHPVKEYTFGELFESYVLFDILDFTLVDGNDLSYLDIGDFDSTYFAVGNVSFDDDGFLFVGYVQVGFDSFEWLNPEHTAVEITFGYDGVVGFDWVDVFGFDWVSVKDLFSHVEFNDKHYYFVSNVYLLQDVTYSFKWIYTVPLDSDGKWDLIGKLSSDTISEALDSGRFVMIDPWWDSSWQYRKYLGIVDKQDDYQMFINVSYNGGGNVSCESHCQDDFGDIRFLNPDNDTELPYYLEFKSNGNYAWFWVNNTGNYSFINLYYGTSGVSVTGSDGDSTFLAFDDFADGDYNGWTVKAGGWSAAAGYLDATSVLVVNYIMLDDPPGMGLQTAVRCKAWEDNELLSIGTGPVMEYQDINNFYHGRIHSKNNIFQLYKWSAAAATLMESTAYGYIDDYWYKAEVRHLSTGVVDAVTWDGNYTELTYDREVATGEVWISGLYGAREYKNRGGMYDDFMVRCYIIPEPSWGNIGSEEQLVVTITFHNFYPINESTVAWNNYGVPVCVNITLNQAFNCYIVFWCNSSGDWLVIGNQSMAVNDSFCVFDSNVTSNQSFYYRVNCTTETLSHYHNGSFWFEMGELGGSVVTVVGGGNSRRWYLSAPVFLVLGLMGGRYFFSKKQRKKNQ